MERLPLSFGELMVLEEDLVEIIVNDGVEVSAAMVEEYHRKLLDHVQCPCRVLVNKKNSYHYSFEAQQCIADMGSVRTFAILAYTRAGEVGSKIIQMFPGKGDWEMSFFSDRETALLWLATKKPFSE